MTTLTSDDDDGTYETTWAATDYQLLPQDAVQSAHWDLPAHALQVLGRGTKSQFERAQSRYRVAGTGFAIGQTIEVASEWMLVTDISSNNLTVERALSDSTGVTHASGESASIVRGPGPVERATLINAARIWSRATAFEPFYVDVDLDSDVRMLLDPYRLGAA